MGLVNTPYDLEDTPEDLLNKIRELSPRIDSYFVNKNYLPHLLEQGLTEMSMDNKLLVANRMLLDELRELGIMLNSDDGEVLTSFNQRELAYHLRKTFSIENLTDLLKDMSEDVREEFEQPSEALDNDEPIDDVIINMVSTMAKNYPGSVLWKFLKDHDDEYMNDVKFVMHVKAMFDSVQLEQPDVLAGDVDMIVRYIQSRDKHIRLVKEATKTLLQEYDNIDKSFIRQMLATHDEDKIAEDRIKTFAMYYEENVSEEDEIESIYEEQHHKTNNHHIEYYETKDLDLTKTSLVLMVADLYGYSDNKEHLKKEAEELIKDHKLLQPHAEMFMKMISSLNYIKSEGVES